MSNLGYIGLHWRQVLAIVIAGLVIGGAFGQAIQVLSPKPQAEFATLEMQPNER
jgi:hypothetical protein